VTAADFMQAFAAPTAPSSDAPSLIESRKPADRAVAEELLKRFRTTVRTMQ
jgi:hypothetical protein